MEHIVQFAINFDDQRITESVEQNAEKVIIDDLKQKINDRLFKSQYYGGHGDPKNGLQDWVKMRVDGFLEEHKQEIIGMAATHLADKLSRTKAARELLKADSAKIPMF